MVREGVLVWFAEQQLWMDGDLLPALIVALVAASQFSCYKSDWDVRSTMLISRRNWLSMSVSSGCFSCNVAIASMMSVCLVRAKCLHTLLSIELFLYIYCACEMLRMWPTKAFIQSCPVIGLQILMHNILDEICLEVRKSTVNDGGKAINVRIDSNRYHCPFPHKRWYWIIIYWSPNLFLSSLVIHMFYINILGNYTFEYNVVQTSCVFLRCNKHGCIALPHGQQLRK